MELITSFIPMFFLQVLNNSNIEGDLYNLMRVAALLKLGSFCFFIIEPIVVASEITHNVRMRKLKVEKYEKLSELDRRRKYGKVMSILAICSIVVFIGLVITGGVLTTNRTCGDRQALQNAVCVNCEDQRCLSCEFNSEKCTKCEGGHVLTPEGKCMDCDDKPYNQCEKCTLGKDGKPVCQQCMDGFRLEGGKCIQCTQSQFCKTCDKDTCIECSDDARMVNGVCIACSASLNHCK